MTLNVFLEISSDIIDPSIGLILDAANQVEPLLKFLLVEAIVLSLD